MEPTLKLRPEGLGGPELAGKMIDGFVEQAQARLEAVCAGGMAGDMRALGKAVGTLQRGAAALGAWALEELAGHIARLAERGEKDLILPLLRELQSELERVVELLRRERQALI